VEAVVFVESNYMQVMVILSQHNTINFTEHVSFGGGDQDCQLLKYRANKQDKDFMQAQSSIPNTYEILSHHFPLKTTSIYGRKSWGSSV